MSLLNFIMFLVAHFFSLFGALSLSVLTSTPNLASSAKLKIVGSVTYSSLIKMLKRKGPDAGPCGSPLATVIQVKYDPLTTF